MSASVCVKKKRNVDVDVDVDVRDKDKINTRATARAKFSATYLPVWPTVFRQVAIALRVLCSSSSPPPEETASNCARSSGVTSPKKTCYGCGYGYG